MIIGANNRHLNIWSILLLLTRFIDFVRLTGSEVKLNQHALNLFSHWLLKSRATVSVGLSGVGENPIGCSDVC